MFGLHIVLLGLVPFFAFNTITPTTPKAPPTAPLEETAQAFAKVSLKGINLEKMRLNQGAYQQKLEGGDTVTFTVIPKLQKFADDMFAKYEVPAAAAVMLNSRTGRVLLLSQQRLKADSAEIDDVALDASPPAASLFKVITTSALLEQSDVRLDTKTCYRGGSSKLLMEHLKDVPKGKGACSSLAFALGRSINAIFAKLSTRHLDSGVLEKYASIFGFNKILPFDVPFAKSLAEFPTEKLERARTSAGFWHTHLSPLHAAMIAQSLAQGGAMLKPYIVDHVKNTDGKTVYESKTKYLGHTVDKETAKKVIEAMTYTVSKGTARKSFRDSKGVSYLPNVQVAGKTGTLTKSRPYRAYTWFMAVAPADKPEIALAVLVVNEPKWRIKAAGAAVQLLKKYFDLKKSK